MVLFYRPNMAVGTSHWDSPLGLGCPNPRVAPLLGLGQSFGLVLVPFLGPNSDSDSSPVGTVPDKVGTVWPCPNLIFASS